VREEYIVSTIVSGVVPSASPMINATINSNHCCRMRHWS